MAKLKINKELQNLLQTLSEDEYSLLEQSILSEGCRDSIVVWNDTIIDGHNRYEICKKHDISFKTHEMQFNDIEQVKDWIDKNQLGKRNLTPDMVRLIRGRIYNRTKSKGHGDKSGRQNVVQNTSEKLADDFGVSAKTIQRDGKFAIEVDNNPKLYEAIKNKENINDIKKEEKKEEQKVVKVEREKVNKVKGVFSVIYADCPWKYSFSQSTAREIENQYPTMELEEIKNIKVPSAKDCVLFFWATAPKLKEAFEVIEAWGFEYKTCSVWDKETIGMGYWFRGQHEILMVATKGNISPPEETVRVSSVYKEKKSKHSKKPNYYYDLIQSYFPGQRYLEMFARQKYNNKWSIWGNENV